MSTRLGGKALIDSQWNSVIIVKCKSLFQQNVYKQDCGKEYYEQTVNVDYNMQIANIRTGCHRKKKKAY